MAYVIDNLYQELGIPTSVTKVEDILAEIEKVIWFWQCRVNNPKYKEEAPARLAALRRLREEIKSVPPIAPAERVYGIDFGSSYSSIAYVDDDGTPVLIPGPMGLNAIPSVVAFDECCVMVGQAAKEDLIIDPENVCSYIKQRLGRKDFSFSCFGREFSPEKITAMILSQLARGAAEVLRSEIKDVVITCPVYFDEEEKKALIKAGELADLNVVSLLPEPVAVALSYGLDPSVSQTILVYDLGSSFDVSILRVSDNVIRIVAFGGDHLLGGEDWDEAIREMVIDKYCADTGESPDSIYDDTWMMKDLELRSENAKKNLSRRESCAVRLMGTKMEISKKEFEQRTSGILGNTIDTVRQTMISAAKQGIDSIDRVLVSGGASIMPQVLECLKCEFPEISIEFEEPGFAVAKGAALYGSNPNRISVSSPEM